jgi:hypothetical protein
MATWKKVIVSGSNASLAEVSASVGFIGDGSGLTGIVEASLANDAVTADKLAANAVVNASIASNAAIAHSKLAALASTKVLVGNGSNVAAEVALSGDVTMTNTGAVTIANNAVETAMIAADAITGAKIADDAIDSEHYTDGSIDTAHIADDAITGAKLADSITIANNATAKNFTASMGVSASHFSASTDIIASGNIISTSGSFVGSGAELTGVSVDIDSLNAGTALHQTQDHFVYSDNGTEKKITFSDVEDAIFGNVSGDATIAAGGALTIANTSVETGMIADDAVTADKLASNAVVNASIAANAAIAHSKLAALASTKVLVGNGENVATEVALSGDVTMNNAGAVTLANNAVVTAKITDANVTLAKIANAAGNTVIVRDASTAGVLSAKAVATTEILIGDGTGFTAASLSGDVTMTNTGAVTIANTAVETAMIAADAITGAKIADDAIDSEHYTDGSIDTAHIADNAVTGDKLADSIVIAADLTVTGDLLVSGDSVTVNTANLNVEDAFILLNSGSSTISNDSGIVFGGTTGTANSGKAIIWDASYNSNDGRLAVSTTAVAGDATANFGASTAGYYVAGVFEGTEANAATALADHPGNIRIESSEIYIYV